jgi:dTDP-4-dehydrorhamnose reductase
VDETGSMTSAPVLLTGATGFLGWSFCAVHHRISQEQADPVPPLICPSRQAERLSGLSAFSIESDFTTAQEQAYLFDQHRPSAVIHTAAMADPGACTSSPELSHHINVVWPEQLAQRCAREHIPFIHCSTDLVFDGTSAPYSESDPTSPLSLYGQQKVESEHRILNAFSDALVLRLPLLFGESSSWSRNGMAHLLQQWQHCEPIGLFRDEFRTPTRALRVAEYIWKQLPQWIAQQDPKGLLHLGGPQRCSRWEMGQLLADVFHLDPTLPKSVLRSDFDLEHARPADTSLDSSKAVELGFQHGSFHDELELIRKSGGWIQEP